ncbi:phage tail protein [Prodigiosinella confusarubida]|uniref:Phage tail protein n=1 Tax=Serratia sp. (strain ATCC 39006) TaxID=104623 RepID=A0A2I5TKS7_SERS3|nr:tail fiber protein [Serratia sp. ATCC 39006]AUH00843.1 phage tail protein [Serratia sp. ATCC 39006]AUH05165.1 phage tail protein [Serratia sp. ATCC 39006]
MDQKFFRVPFASSGDTQAIPDTTTSDGSVNYPSGWGPDYAKDPAADANAKPVEREAMNSVLNAITTAIRQYQTNTYPEWITTANNNGAAFGYDAGVVVEYNGVLYLSLVDNNTATPGVDETKWQVYIQLEATEEEAIAGEGSTQVITPRRLHAAASYLDNKLKSTITEAMAPYLLPVGAIILWSASTPPDGWLELNGQSFDISENPKLVAIYPGGRVPDWRGRFVRAWANGSTIDPDSSRSIGSYQDDALQNITGSFIADIVATSRAGQGVSGAFADEGGVGTGDPGNQDDLELRKYSFDASRVVRTATETRPTNIAAMYIIKTDKAEAVAGEQTPTAIVITPGTKTLNAGLTQLFSATVLPGTLADNYPVSWTVSDSSLGSIDSNGLYTSKTGESGTQTIIASISTGLASTATITQHVYLTAISIGSAPSELIAGNSYSIAVTYFPDNYTETVNASSSDSSIASLSSSGTLTISGAGTATLSLTGTNSGVTESLVITSIEIEEEETYLQINENLAEIAGKGSTAQATARTNLGLKALATQDSLTADDVGAVPQANVTLGTENLNTVLSPGRKFQSLTSSATLARNYPVALAGMLDVIKTTATGLRQIYYPYNTTEVYHRYCVDTTATTPAFSSWLKEGSGFLTSANNLSDVTNATVARQNLGVSYTISTDAVPTDASSYSAGHIWYQVEE